MFYIQLKSPWAGLETVEECHTLKEARTLCREYQFSDPSGFYYISRRACKAWAAK
jgi:hypothetical protein